MPQRLLPTGCDRDALGNHVHSTLLFPKKEPGKERLDFIFLAEGNTQNLMRQEGREGLRSDEKPHSLKLQRSWSLPWETQPDARPVPAWLRHGVPRACASPVGAVLASVKRPDASFRLQFASRRHCNLANDSVVSRCPLGSAFSLQPPVVSFCTPPRPPLPRPPTSRCGTAGPGGAGGRTWRLGRPGHSALVSVHIARRAAASALPPRQTQVE